MAGIDELYIKILADGSQLAGGLNQAQGKLDGFSQNIAKIGGVLAGAFSVVAIERFLSKSIEAFDESERAQAKVAQVIKSTGGVANMSLKELTETAAEFQKSTLFEDDTILNNVTAQLLTFTNIAGTNFKRAQEAAMNLATVLDGDLKGASIQLGKALNDPVKGMMALSRSGIQFSADQTAVIKNLAETNRLAEAQTLILNELDIQYGWQARAAAQASNGIVQLKNAFGDLMENIGGAISKSNEFRGAVGYMSTQAQIMGSGEFSGLEKFIMLFNPWADKHLEYRNLLAKEAKMKEHIALMDIAMSKGPTTQGQVAPVKKETTLTDLKQELADYQTELDSSTEKTRDGINKNIERIKSQIKAWEDSGKAVTNYKGSIKGLQAEVDILNQKRDSTVGAANIAAVNDQITKKQEEIDVLKKASSEWVAYGQSAASAISVMSGKIPILDEVKAKLVDSSKVVEDAKAKAMAEMQQWSDFVQQAMSSAISGAANMIGNLLGDLISGQSDAFGSALGAIGSIVGQVGQMAISLGSTMLAMQMMLKNPTNPLGPLTLIGLGIAAVAIGKVMSNQAKSIGSGGGGGGGYGSGGLGSNEFDTRTNRDSPSGPQTIILRAEGRDLVATFDANQIFQKRKG